MQHTSSSVDVSGRSLRLRDVDLDTFLHPRTVAVIGASETSRKPNAVMTSRIKAWSDAHGATFFPVHPVYDTVLGARCYPTVEDVPGDIDLAVILTGKAVETFEEVVQRKAKFAVIFAAGFAETGEAGERLEAQLAALVRSGDTRLLGPNTNLNAFSEFRDDLPGPSIALITQSGHQGRPVFQGQELGIAVSHWAPTGNEVDLEFADFARYFADQPEVGVVAAYIEGFKDGRSLMLAAAHAAQLGKPIVVVKVGRTDAGRTMAKAHTGHLTGADAVVSAAFRQLGVTRVDGLDELLDTAAALARTRRAAPGDGVCVYAISGGTGAHMADMLEAAGLRLPALTDATQRELYDGLIPSYLRVSNPVDCGGPPVSTPAGRKIIDLLLADPNVDILVCPITGALESMSMPVGTEPAYREVLLQSQLPVFRTFSNCVQAVKAHVDYARFVEHYRSPFDSAPVEPMPEAETARALLAAAGPGGALSEHDSKQLLAAYGIASAQEVVCTNGDDAVAAASQIGHPIVMKVASPDVSHKSELGLVRVGLTTDDEVRAAFDELLAAGRGAAGPDGSVDGVLVCEQVSDGVEMVVGISQDELFGPVVMAGLGGVLVEVLRDVTFRIPPFSHDEAARMLSELRGFPILEGVRGAGAVDVAALVDVIVKVQRLALDLAGPAARVGISELDINPLVVRPHGAVALDALVVAK